MSTAVDTLCELVNNLTFLFTVTLLVQLMAFGGACHIAVVSKKCGWWFLAAGIALITLRRVVSLNEVQASYLILFHAAIVLAGITLIFKCYSNEVDGLTELANSVPNMVTITDAAGEPIFLNKRWRHYTGLALVAMQERMWENIIHPDDLEEVVRAWNHALATAEPFEMDLRIRGENGRYRWFLSRAYPLRCRRGKVVRWYASCTDIHERKEGTLWLMRKAEEVSVGKTA